MADRRLGAALLALALASGCDSEKPTAQREQSAADPKFVAETQLMANVALAGPELARRLASFVQRNGRVLVIRNHRFGLTVNGEEIIPPSTDFMITAMPANAPWAVRCKKEGLSIAFGPSIFGEVSEGSGDIGPEAVVALTNVPLSDQQCTDLVPAVADALLSIAFP